MPIAFNFKRAPSTTAGPPPPPEAIEAFKGFVDAESFSDAKGQFESLLGHLGINHGPYREFYPKFKSSLKDHVPFKYKEIFKILDARAKQKPYNGIPAEKQQVLVVGAGPCGLRTAIETQLLGARTVIVEKRDEFTRYNILKLWKFLLTDMKGLGVKKFVGKFCSGSINHIGIQTLQLFMAKVCMFLGIEIHAPVQLKDIIEPTEEVGWRVQLSPLEGYESISSQDWNMIVIASGKRVPIEGFNRRSLDAKLSIAITANFVNHGSSEEVAVQQISGISKQYHQDFFKELDKEKNIELENIVYYRGATHYFVMTALRKSLLERGVILEDIDDRKALLAPSNIDKEKLHKFAIDAAQFSTKHFSTMLPTTEFALNARGVPDCAIFDFTNLYSARNSCLVKVRRGYQLLLAIVGDSLLEPFWPEGTGCGRGFLSSLDAAWLLRQWCLARVNPLEILTERENVYKLLSQTTDDGGNLKTDHKAYTIDPKTRYKSVPKKIDHDKILSLYDTDMAEEFAFLKERFVNKQFFDRKEHKTLLQRMRTGIVQKKSQMVKAMTIRRQRSQAAAE